MPANTDVRSAEPPLRRPTIISCFGPIAPGTTPRISTLNSSGSLPRNTVLAVPLIPSLSSESGKKAAELADLDELEELTGACAIADCTNIEKMTINTRVLGFNIFKKLFPQDGEYGNILTGFSEASSCLGFP